MSSRTLRTWATPLAGAVFVVMAVTGVLMFFDLNTPLGHELHEWVGWALVVGVALHLATNWGPLKVHLSKWPGRALAVAGVVLTLVAVVPLDRTPRAPNPVRGVMTALSRAPLKDLAPLAHREVGELVAQLQQAGFAQATPESTAESLAGEAREDRGRVLGIIFPAPAEQPRG